jgi:8-hydroxy-5-deazaflavin:NADPH oxidoreductase
MKYAVLGFGEVGQTIAKKLVELGHDVYVGTRDPNDPIKLALVGQLGPQASLSDYQHAAYGGDVVINCTPGNVSLEVIESIGEASLHDKTLIDLANSIKLEDGVMKMGYSPDTSLAEQIQALVPSTKVVKTLNTVNKDVMVHPGQINGQHNIFIATDNQDAASAARAILGSFGWQPDQIIALPGLESARAMEAYLSLWLKLSASVGTMNFNIGILK